MTTGLDYEKDGWKFHRHSYMRLDTHTMYKKVDAWPGAKEEGS